MEREREMERDREGGKERGMRERERRKCTELTGKSQKESETGKDW